MNLATVSLSYLRARRLSTSLNVLLLALGIATITLLLLATSQLEERMQRDARGIDLVVGAKGSPMQIILSSIYQLDVPTGNVSWQQAQELARHRFVKKIIPLAMGDNYRGFRIVGTTHDYVAHYGARLAHGQLWKAPLEAVLGAEVAAGSGLSVGAHFAGAHGMGGGSEGEKVHDEHQYRVVGVLAPSGSVVDRIVLTSVESLWAVHAEQYDIKDIARIGELMSDEEKEYTALLIQYASPIAAASLPRYINQNSAMQAASPAYEITRLFTIIGVGVDVLRGFAVVLILAAGLSVFIALYNALSERRYDLAVMRALGASPAKLMSLMLFEGLLLALIGAAIGIALGHALTGLLGLALTQAKQVSVSGMTWVNEELWLIVLALGVGVVAALLPAWRAYRTDVAATLARG
ncbi:MAG TPA: ABC transporter permease [Burkholderiales bacterium]|nr:ABC transporter permease [Burkholderiales bacterium]